jgi:hypothetical protein
MRRNVIRRACGAAVVLAVFGFHLAISPPNLPAAAAVSATIVPGTLVQGSTQASLTGGSYASEGNNLHDWPLMTGGTTTKSAISLSNANFNGNAFGGTPNSMVAFGNGGGVTLRFDVPVNPVAGQKEFGIFTAQMLTTTGGLFNGNMEAAVLVSDDAVVWRTLAGEVIAAPTTYVATSQKLNAPTHAYDYNTSATAWGYGSPGTSQENLDALNIADFALPMPDDNLFNGSGTNADRAALSGDASPANYDAIFGTSGGGNWFDISSSGLTQVQYVRLNGVNVGGGVRLDAVFANVAAVPEPAGFAMVALAGLALARRRMRTRGRHGVIAAGVLAAAVMSLASARSAQAVGFDDIQYWVGTGSNRAAFVMDWNDAKTPESLIWGYRWDGAASGEQMLRAIVAADPRLFAHVGAAGSFGVPLWGSGYDLDDDGNFAVNPPLSFDSGGLSTGTGDDSRAPADAADHWREGFNNSFWGYYDGGTGASPAWAFGSAGMSDRVLVNNAWDGWSFAPGFADTLPSEPVAAAPPVPEPATIGLAAIAALALSRRRRRRVRASD